MTQKYEHLKEIIASYERLIVAFSGGVDSSFLLKTAYDILGSNALAITVSTPYIAAWEINDARRVAKEIGVSHLVIEKPWIDAIRHNPENRCYLCKHALFSSLSSFATEHDFSAIAEGSNVDDTLEYRPGRVALGELGIKTPLLDAGLSKKEIRSLSQELGLSTWDKPSYACLLTRFAYDKPIVEGALTMVGRAEAYMIAQGYPQMRVRYEDGLARIEMPQNEALRLLNDHHLNDVTEHLKSLGFLHVTLDLEGYRHGSIAESLSILEKV